jgi:preprotein translocase subunit YajC
VNAVLSLLAQDDAQGGGIFSILILVLPLGALLYLMVIPQRKQRAKHAQFVASLGVGDEVVTAGGIYGTITYLEDGIAHVEVDTDVVIRVTIASITRAAGEPDPAERGSSALTKGSNGSSPKSEADGDDAEQTESQ